MDGGCGGLDLGERVHRVAWGIIDCFFTTTSPTPYYAVFNCREGVETGVNAPTSAALFIQLTTNVLPQRSRQPIRNHTPQILLHSLLKIPRGVAAPQKISPVMSCVSVGLLESK